MSADPGVCENCAGEDEDLVAVWPSAATGSDQPELWCAGCREQFPNEPAADEDETL